MEIASGIMQASIFSRGYLASTVGRDEQVIKVPNFAGRYLSCAAIHVLLAGSRASIRHRGARFGAWLLVIDSALQRALFPIRRFHFKGLGAWVLHYRGEPEGSGPVPDKRRVCAIAVKIGPHRIA